DAVVCTVYAWTLPTLAPLGLRLPIKTFVHQRYVTTPIPNRASFPAVNANPLGGYIRPAHDGRILMGIETPERDEHRVTSLDFRMPELTVDPTLRDRSHPRFIELAPALRDATWESQK